MPERGCCPGEQVRPHKDPAEERQEEPDDHPGTPVRPRPSSDTAWSTSEFDGALGVQGLEKGFDYKKVLKAFKKGALHACVRGCDAVR